MEIQSPTAVTCRPLQKRPQNTTFDINISFHFMHVYQLNQFKNHFVAIEKPRKSCYQPVGPLLRLTLKGAN